MGDGVADCKQSNFNLASDWAEEEVFVFPASFAQQRLWFIDQLMPGASFYTIPIILKLTGVLDRAALESSLEAIVHRHEVLRTAFDVVDGQLVQVVCDWASVALPLVELQSLPEGDFLAEELESSREEIALIQIRERAQQPFDLTQGPLFRLGLWRLGETDHLLLIALHHIIFDEWSSGVLIRELGEFYAAAVNDRPLELPALSIQYADFAGWQREWLQGEVLNAQLHYWRQQLKDVPRLNLPVLNGLGGYPSRQSNRGASQLLELPQGLLDQLEELSQAAGVTLFMTLLAAFQTLLHRYTGQTDIAIGSPIANRHRSELEGLIGFLVNSLVLRSNLSDDPPFRVLLDRVREVTLAAYAHQDVPFEKLVEELQPVRSLNQNPLFQVVFALQNTPMTQLELPGLTLSPVAFETETTRFDLELYVWKCDGNFRSLWGKGWQQSEGLRGVVVYHRDLFDDAAIVRLRQQFQWLLEGVVTNPDSRLSTLPLMTQAEQQQQWSLWNQTQTDYPENWTVHELFETQVRQRSHAIAVQFGQQQFTYRELNQGSNQLARYLQKLGIEAGMRVGICLGQSAETIAAILAVLKAGAAYLPLDPDYPPERLRFMLEDAEVPIVITQLRWQNLFENDVKVIALEQEWQTIAQESEENLANRCPNNPLAYVMYTSGSTGTPKGVMVSHRAIVRLVCDTNYVQIKPEMRIAQAANLAFDAATFEIWGALLNGACLVGIERDITLSPADFAAALQEQQIDAMFLTTALLNQTVSQIPAAFRSLTYLLFGGEAANPDHVRTILEQGKPQHLIHVYGPTENTTFSTWYEVENVLENAVTIPIGKAIANTQVYVLDTNLMPVPPGIIGEIYLGGDGLAQGYLNQPQLTQERFIDHPVNQQRLYKTGDRARYDTNGNLEFLGRTDYQVKIRGFRIELGEIETALLQHPEIEAALLTVREIEADRQLIAYVVPKAVKRLSVTELELRSFLKAKLPAYLLPAAFVVLDALPLTPNGKVNHRALPLPSLTSIDPVTATAPTTSLEQVLVDLWQQLLGREAGIHDNFFELGGHSLLATQLVSRLRDRFRVEIPLRTVFETPTIAALAQKIEAMPDVDLSQFQSLTQLSAAMPSREEIEL